MVLQREFDVHVTENHIDEGVVGCPNRCALALAVLDALPDEDISVFIGDDTVSMQTDNEFYTFDTSCDVWDFIEAFDNDNASVNPMSLRLVVKDTRVHDHGMLYHTGIAL